jgi:hypothetical protein
MSDAFGVEDDGSGRAALDIAGQAVRAFNHRTNTRFDDVSQGRTGWSYVPDIYRCLGELTYLTGGLRQVIEHMSSAMKAQLEAGGVGADAGSPYEGRPEDAIAAARAALGAAEAAATNLYAGFETAQTAVSRIHYTGPDFADSDD